MFMLFQCLEQTYDIGILLGGYSNFLYSAIRERYQFYVKMPIVLRKHMELYKDGKIRKILLLSGGTLEVLLQKEPKEALEIELLNSSSKWNVTSSEDIIIEPNSRNTYENATLSQMKYWKRDYPQIRTVY